MIDEDEQDLAIQYVFGTLEGEEARAFAGMLGVDAELAAFVDELRAAAAALAHAVPQQAPPAHLRAKILAVARGETAAAPVQFIPLPSAPTARPVAWLPWAIAASLAVTSGLLWMERQRLQQVAEAQAMQMRFGSAGQREDAEKQAAQIEKLRQVALAAQQETVKARNDIQALEAEAKIFQERDLALQKEVAGLKGRDALAQVTIATLSAQVSVYAKAGAVVVWDAAQQRGVIKLANLPQPAAGKDYQLWVIDPKYPSPVSGGVVRVDGNGFARTVFHPDQPITSADKFAISVEASGGVPKAAGPIVFLGN